MAKKRATKSNLTQSQYGVGYAGDVKIAIKKQGKTIRKMETHNSGTVWLFDGIAQFLSGAFTNMLNNSSNYLPKYLGVGVQAAPSATDPLMESLEREYDIGERIRLDIGNVKLDITTKSIVLPITGLITHDMINDWDVFPITELGLFPTSGINSGKMLARVLIPSLGDSEAQGLKLGQGESATIQWDLVVQNTLISSESEV